MKHIITQIVTITFFVLLFSQITSAQPFQISVVNAERYTLDRFTNEVYYYDIFTSELYKTNLETMETSTADFPSLPAFANKTHFAVYRDSAGIFKYDFETDSSFLLIEEPQSLNKITTNNTIGITRYGVSPKDTFVLYGKINGDTYGYDFNKEKSYKLDSAIFIEYSTQWGDDSTIVYLDEGYYDKIIQHNIATNMHDTLLAMEQYVSITCFSYNNLCKIIAYSILEDYPKLHLYYVEEKKDTVVFDYEIRDELSSYCWNTPVAFTSLAWSLDNKEVAFFSEGQVNPYSGIYIYKTDSSKTYRYSDCDYYGVKYFLDWYNKDTLIYFNATDRIIYGYEVSSPITSVEDDNKLPKVYLLIQNYPNPFNPSTTISFSIPEEGKVELVVYDILGRKVAELVNETLDAGKYNVNFDGSDLSSGMYIYKLTAGSFSESKKMIMVK